MNGLSINLPTDINEIRKEHRSLELRAKKKIDLSFDSLFGVTHLTLTAAVTIFFAITTRDIGQTIVVFFAYIYIPGMIASAIVAGLLSFAVGERLERYLENRRVISPWYERYQYLDTYLSEYDTAENLRLAEERRIQLQKLAEEKQIRLQPVSNEIQLIRNEVNKIEEVITVSENVIWRKRKWYSEYRKYEDAIGECIPKLEDFRSQSQLIRAKFGQLAEEVSYEFDVLSRRISLLTQRCQSVLEKMESMKDWTPPIQTRSPSRRPTIFSTVQSTETRTTGQPSQVQTFFSSDIEDNEIKQPVVVPMPQPPKPRELNRKLENIPFANYIGAAEAMMKIGEIGEIIVLHYELKRVEEETGLPSLGKVIRVSEESNRFGYDIESFSEDNKVFIEVKSTSGEFWKDFFLSENERRAMENLGERYWLYRIFELSKEDGSAKLSIFRGKAEIEATFELEATNYKFVAKTDFTDEHTLPFEAL